MIYLFVCGFIQRDHEASSGSTARSTTIAASFITNPGEEDTNPVDEESFNMELLKEETIEEE